MASDEAKLYQKLRDTVTVAPLTEVLPQLLLLAKDLKATTLECWTQLELQGYLATNQAMTEETVVPEYRGVTGLWYNAHNQPLIIQDDAELSNTINSYRLRNGVAELEEMSRANTNHSVFDQSLPSILRQQLHFDARHFTFQSREVAGVLSEIRSRAITWLTNVKDQIPHEAQTAPDANTVKPSAATVFYSWQSDLPNRTNRGFIEDCLERSIKELKAESDLRIDPALDRDTKDVPGSPDIAATIFEKIESCGLFVCDVSIINKGATGRPTPNPNVLIELGFAVKCLGWNRVICVFNEETGSIADLPFDLRHRRVRPYKLAETQDKADTRKRLTGMLKADIGAAFAFLEEELAISTESTETTEAEPRIPTIEVLDATLECQPPIAQPSQDHIHHIRPEYIAGKLVWSIAASFYLDSRPGERLSVALHRCTAWMNDRYSGKKIPIADLRIYSDPNSQVRVDDAVLSIEGPGRFSIEGSCETPSRNSGFPDILRIDVQLPVSEMSHKAISGEIELHEMLHGDGWPLRWKHRETES